jgi:hypothetical protein
VLIIPSFIATYGKRPIKEAPRRPKMTRSAPPYPPGRRYFEEFAAGDRVPRRQGSAVRRPAPAQVEV